MAKFVVLISVKDDQDIQNLNDVHALLERSEDGETVKVLDIEKISDNFNDLYQYLEYYSNLYVP